MGPSSSLEETLLLALANSERFPFVSNPTELPPVAETRTTLIEVRRMLTTVLADLVSGPLESLAAPTAGEPHRALAATHLVERLGQPEEVVPLAVYLASDPSSFMTDAAMPSMAVTPHRDAVTRTACRPGLPATEPIGRQ